jgi:hypothetical protein
MLIVSTSVFYNIVFYQKYECMQSHVPTVAFGVNAERVIVSYSTVPHGVGS